MESCVLPIQGNTIHGRCKKNFNPLNINHNSSSSSSSSESSSSSLGRYAENARLELECITLRREIQNTKAKRKKNKECYEKMKTQYHAKLAQELVLINRILQDYKMLSQYSDAVKSFYQNSNGDNVSFLPASYVLRKHAEVIQQVRNQALLDVYLKKIEHHNKELIKSMKNRALNLITGLIVQEVRRNSVKKQIVHLIRNRWWFNTLFPNYKSDALADFIHSSSDDLIYSSSSDESKRK
mmetsp:Transcript_15774/g.23898  ORF Transcript_15774/g.23898 Transcript_15774/m.23898 type:complete len:239 (-) Transcript_15774:280-996(-)